MAESKGLVTLLRRVEHASNIVTDIQDGLFCTIEQLMIPLETQHEIVYLTRNAPQFLFVDLLLAYLTLIHRTLNFLALGGPSRAGRASLSLVPTLVPIL